MTVTVIRQVLRLPSLLQRQQGRIARKRRARRQQQQQQQQQMMRRRRRKEARSNEGVLQLQIQTHQQRSEQRRQTAAAVNPALVQSQNLQVLILTLMLSQLVLLLVVLRYLPRCHV
jgi:hypothetical protein